MPDKKLITLILIGGVLYLGHAIDHAARGDVRWPLGAESLPFIAVTVVIYAVIGFGIYFYRRNRIGPRFWTVFAALGAAFGLLGHFSPFSEQPPSHIFNAYSSAWAGALALSCLFALMLVLIVVTLYAGYLWARKARV